MVKIIISGQRLLDKYGGELFEYGIKSPVFHLAMPCPAYSTAIETLISS